MSKKTDKITVTGEVQKCCLIMPKWLVIIVQLVCAVFGGLSNGFGEAIYKVWIKVPNAEKPELSFLLTGFCDSRKVKGDTVKVIFNSTKPKKCKIIE